MSVIDEYIANLKSPEKTTIEHMCSVVRQLVPSATEEISYAMPSFKYKGKGLVAIIVNKNFMSLYPFGSVEKLGVDLSAYKQTTGSIHFTQENPIPDQLLTDIILARKLQIER